MKIKSFIENFEDATVQIGSHVTYKQREIIDKNNQMRNGQYEDKYFDDGETEKLYYNVIFGFAQTLKRGSRLKLSEFSASSVNGKLLKMVDIVRMGLRHFLRYNGFNEKKEEVLDELVDMGHVVAKVVDGENTVVDLRNLVFKPNAKTLKEEGCAERIFLTYEEAKAEYGETEHWTEINEFYEGMPEEDKPFIPFIEYWTIDEFEVKGKKEITKGCIKYLDRSDQAPDENKTPDDWEPYLELDRFVSPHKVPTRNKRERRLFGKEKLVFPYDEERLVRIPGRYLGAGVYELCRPSQEDYNEKRNTKRKFDRLALRGILVHKVGQLRDETDGEALTQEFLKRMDTGSALKIFSDEELTRLNMGSTTPDTVAMTNDLFEFMRFLLE